MCSRCLTMLDILDWWGESLIRKLIPAATTKNNNSLYDIKVHKSSWEAQKNVILFRNISDSDGNNSKINQLN